MYLNIYSNSLSNSTNGKDCLYLFGAARTVQNNINNQQPSKSIT